MKNLILALMAVLLMACDSLSKQALIISFDFPENPNDTVEVYQVNALDFSSEELAKVTLNKVGIAKVRLFPEEYTFAAIRIGEEIFHVLLYPAGEQHISGSLEDLPSAIRFSGTGAEANSYLRDLLLIYEEHEEWKGKSFVLLDPADYEERQRQIDQELYSLRSGLPDEVRNSEKVLNLLDAEAESRKLWEALNNELVQQQALNIDPGSLLSHPHLLSAHSMNYLIALNLFYQSRISNAIMSPYGPEQMDSISYLYPELAFKEVQSLETTDQVKELLGAKILFESFSAEHLNPVLLNTFEQWKTSFPRSKYLAAIEGKKQDVQQLEAGITAPEIIGITPEGQELKLSDLLGKVVYVKVWATWCSPCIRSFPDLAELEARISSEGLQILCVSPDRDQKQWRKFLEKNEVVGLHISVESEKFRNDYLVSGIPRYILIDSEGRIANPNAPDPDKKGLLDEINSLIRQAG